MQFPVFATNLSPFIDNHVAVVDFIRASDELVQSAQGQPEAVAPGQVAVPGEEFAGRQGFGECQRFLAIFTHEIAAFGEEDKLEMRGVK